ncbi:MAG: transcriptional regulator, partial [Candidatus Diapherotrites archaeon]|nr:transcriptional regulator [Candidatus Diapherotrites archaeon]
MNWRRASERYRLEGTKCENCGSYFFPPRPMCPKC